MNMKVKAKEDLGAQDAKESLLQSLIERTRRGEVLSNDDVQRELELVGLRERTWLTQRDEKEMVRASDVSWKEALLGRTRRRSDAEEEKDAMDTWASCEYNKESLGLIFARQHIAPTDV